MKNKVMFIFLSGLLIFGFLANAAAFAGGEDIKDRMKTRLSTIISLKQKGIIGEDNKGFLQFVGNDRENVEVVNAENNDRKIVYDAIAKNQGVTPDTVGSRRALQIAEKADPGEWFQDVNGNWYKK